MPDAWKELKWLPLALICSVETHTVAPNIAPTPAVKTIAIAPQNLTPIAAGFAGAPPAIAPNPPGNARKKFELAITTGIKTDEGVTVAQISGKAGPIASVPADGHLRPAQLIADTQRHGVEVHPPDVNASEWECTLEDIVGSPSPVLRLGLRMISRLPYAAVEQIRRSREHGPFRSIEEFQSRTSLARSLCQHLAQADAFASQGIGRRQALWKSLPGRESGQLFLHLPDSEPAAPLPQLSPMRDVTADYQTIGLSLRAHIYAVQSTDRGPKNASRLVPIPNRSGLAKDNVTIADALRAAGYATGIIGKWHLDGPEGAEPGEQGFDTVHQSHHTWSDATADEPQNPKGIFSLTRGAMAFMEHNRDRPFFLYLSHYAIHTEHQARPETLARFQKKKPGSQHSDPLYAACLYDLDVGVGQLIEKLSLLGLEKNSLVVFTSDNGGTQTSSQEPLRGNKGSYYEGGIREPFIARWPAVIKPGSRCDVPVINVDLFPTFLAAADAPVPAGKLLDGENILPLFRGTGTLSRQSIFWHFPGYLGAPVIRGRDLDVRTGFRSRPVSVIRQGDWKLHLFHEEWVLDEGRDKLATNHAVELYNLSADPGERHDLAQEQPARRDAILNDLLAWIKNTGALLPSQPNPIYDPATAQTRGGQGKPHRLE